MSQRSIVRAVAVAATAAIALTACSDDGPQVTTSPALSPSPAAESAAFPVTITADNGEFTFESAPERIVSLSPTATEMLYAVGAGDQVVAVDPFSYFPPEAPTQESLNTFPEPSIESISAFEPDLVLFATETGTLTSSLDSIGITAVQFDAVADFDDIYTQIELIGAITGHIDGAVSVVASMQTDLAAALATLPEGTEGLTYFHEVSTDYYTATSSSFIGKVYAQLGLVNIADEAGRAAGTDFPQVSSEVIVPADPDLIFLADLCVGEPNEFCVASIDDVGERDGWSDMTAVSTGGVIAVDADLSSRWGPRIVEFLEAVITALVARADALANA